VSSIKVENLTMKFNGFTAVDNISFIVKFVIDLYTGILHSNHLLQIM